MKKILTAMTLLLASFSVLSHNLALGERLPNVTITDKGYVGLVNGEFGYREWSTNELQNKVILIQHIAGRTSAKLLNKPMIDKLKKLKFPIDKYNTATLVNLNDVGWFPGAIVVSQVGLNKVAFPDAIFVLDQNGDMRNEWGLSSGSSAIILLDKEGKILYVKDGEMNSEEIDTVVGLIRDNM